MGRARKIDSCPAFRGTPTEIPTPTPGEAILADHPMEQGKPPRDIKAIVHSEGPVRRPARSATAPLAHDGRLGVGSRRHQRSIPVRRSSRARGHRGHAAQS